MENPIKMYDLGGTPHCCFPKVIEIIDMYIYILFMICRFSALSSGLQPAPADP